MGKFIGQIPGVLEIAALYYCIIDNRSPARVRLVGLAALLYLLFPFDIIPDFLIAALGLGALDDITVLYGAYVFAKAHIKPSHREKARRLFNLDQ